MELKTTLNTRQLSQANDVTSTTDDRVGELNEKKK